MPRRGHQGGAGHASSAMRVNRSSLGILSVIGLADAFFAWFEVRNLRISSEPWNAAVVA
jgi:hypothetical protein